MLSWNFKIISVNFMFPLYIVMPALEASRASLVAQMVKNPSAVQETQVRYLGWKDPLEKWMATHSRILAWKILKESDTTERLSLHSTSNTSKNFLTQTRFS